jgi:ribose transport system ATP-binding protein
MTDSKDLVPDPPPSILSASGVAKSYGPVVALRSVDIVVRPGEIHALLGANGAGTFVKVIAGVIRRDAGTAAIDDQPIDFHMPSDASRAGIATVYQDPALIPDLSLDQNLVISGLKRADVEPWLERLELGGFDFGLLVRDVPLATLRLAPLPTILDSWYSTRSPLPSRRNKRTSSST